MSYLTRLSEMPDIEARFILNSFTRDEVIELEYEDCSDHFALLKMARWLAIHCRVLEGQERYEMVQRYLDSYRAFKKLNDECSAIGIDVKALAASNMKPLATHVVREAFGQDV
jgi:hypothetical protein